MNTNICLSMIVKNEERVLARCLRSVRPLLSSWVIVDTGSTDDTERVARAALEGIPGEFVRRPWVDFSTNRNQALELSRARADYSLVVDADDELEFAPGWTLPRLTRDVYAIQNVLGDIVCYRRLLLKSTAPLRFDGIVHESPVATGPVTEGVLDGVIYRRHSGEGARSRDPNKYLRDAEVLEKALQKQPNDPRNVYFLAQSYRDHGDFAKARGVYERRIQMGGDPDELYMSMFQAAEVMTHMNAPLEEIIPLHLRAHAYRPERAESMLSLARTCRTRGEYGLAHAFASAANAIPRPRDPGATTLDEGVYRWKALQEYALACTALGFVDEARKATRRLIDEARAPQEVVLQARWRMGEKTEEDSARCADVSGRVVSKKMASPHLA